MSSIYTFDIPNGQHTPLEEIEMRFSDLCAENPAFKYEVYLSVNTLTDEEIAEVKDKIKTLK